MIVVKIELMSAITGRTTEIGRMYITNDGQGTADRGNYDVAVCRRGTTDVPSPCRPGGPRPTRDGKVRDYPRKAYNVWRLILRALASAFHEERQPFTHKRDDAAEAWAVAYKLAQAVKRGVGSYEEFTLADEVITCHAPETDAGIEA